MTQQIKTTPAPAVIQMYIEAYRGQKLTIKSFNFKLN